MRKDENKIVYQDNVKTIFLIESPKYGNKEVIIDTEDWNRVKRYRWSVFRRRHNSFGCSTYKSLYLHRIIMNLSDQKDVDHINHDPLDNRKKNLRICTNEQNNWNQSAKSNNTSGFKGVSWHKVARKWSVEISYNKKRIRLGLFCDKDSAALAYNVAALKYHGEFACLNQVAVQ